jgi:hypothetical protein
MTIGIVGGLEAVAVRFHCRFFEALRSVGLSPTQPKYGRNNQMEVADNQKLKLSTIAMMIAVVVGTLFVLMFSIPYYVVPEAQSNYSVMTSIYRRLFLTAFIFASVLVILAKKKASKSELWEAVANYAVSWVAISVIGEGFAEYVFTLRDQSQIDAANSVYTSLIASALVVGPSAVTLFILRKVFLVDRQSSTEIAGTEKAAPSEVVTPAKNQQETSSRTSRDASRSIETDKHVEAHPAVPNNINGPRPSSDRTHSSATANSSSRKADPEIRKKEMETSTKDDDMNGKWEAFVGYSSIADGVVSSLWEKGAPNFLAYEYLFELKKFVLSKDKITETKDEIVEAVIQSTEILHKVTEAEEVQLLYQKVRSADPVKAEELKGVIEFLGDGADIKKLEEKFEVKETKFPLLTEIDLENLEETVAAKTEVDKSKIAYKGYELRFNHCHNYDVFERGTKITSGNGLISESDAKAFIEDRLYRMSGDY